MGHSLDDPYKPLVLLHYKDSITQCRSVLSLGAQLWKTLEFFSLFLIIAGIDKDEVAVFETEKTGEVVVSVVMQVSRRYMV